MCVCVCMYVRISYVTYIHIHTYIRVMYNCYAILHKGLEQLWSLVSVGVLEPTPTPDTQG